MYFFKEKLLMYTIRVHFTCNIDKAKFKLFAILHYIQYKIIIEGKANNLNVLKILTDLL